MHHQKIVYACDYESKDAGSVSRVLGFLVRAWQPDYIQMEWVSDNDRYEEGSKSAPAGIRSQIGSGLIRLGRPRETADEEWLVTYAPWSFSAELYNRSRRVLIDIADASSLTVELRDDAQSYAPQVREIFKSLDLKIDEI